MGNNAKKRIKLACAALLLIYSLTYFVAFNMTDSLPIGVYLRKNKQLEAEDIVKICPPDNEVVQLARERLYISAGFCPGRNEALIKKVLALPGDEVRVEPEGLYINGRIVENTAILFADSQHRAMPYEVTTYQIKPGQIFIYSDYNDKSFDSRYFGPVDSKGAMVLTPIWTK